MSTDVQLCFRRQAYVTIKGLLVQVMGLNSMIVSCMHGMHTAGRSLLRHSCSSLVLKGWYRQRLVDGARSETARYIISDAAKAYAEQTAHFVQVLCAGKPGRCEVIRHQRESLLLWCKQL
jgi:hypothetical protein